VVEGQDVVDAIAQGDLLESVEIEVGEEAEKWNAIEAFITFRSNKRDIALKADAEAAMEN
jgi:peptidyl-prolyl cis-trans isomerase A (cyclophilin A)